MLKSLDYSIQFPTGKQLAASLEFERGMTAISGRNEAGKSMVLEMIRFGLFGSAALRGKSSDYKKMSMKLVFEVKGASYTVVRTGSKAELSGADGMIASGTKPVNSHILSLFGYDLTVFDTANNCAQGEIERLGSMKPTERKALVDQTVGLSAIDDLIKWASDEISSERKIVEALESVVVEPTAPEKPDNYRPSDEIEPEYTALAKLKDEHNVLLGWMASARLQEPSAPAPAPSQSTADELAAHERARRENDKLRRDVEFRISQIPTTQLTVQELDEAEAALGHNEKVDERADLEARHPLPELSAEDIERAETAYEAKRLLDEIARLESAGHITCPACDSDFACEHDSIEKLVEQLKALGPYNLSFTERYSIRDLHRFMAMLDSRERVRERIEMLPTVKLDCRLTRHEISYAREALRQRSNLESLHKCLDDLPELDDRSDELVAMRAWEETSRAYERQKLLWGQFVAERAVKSARLQELEALDIAARLGELSASLQNSRVYETQKRSYDEAILRYAGRAQEIVERKERLEDFEKARKALRELKVRVKGYLLPSLNRVASALLSAMTGGERSTVHIDDDFEIAVDGQPLSTLSGSGKAVANLAIRLGLGQVLTNKVFSVFMADEIDAAMDVSRAGYTAECLSRLTSNIGQVILVSHKTVNAQHHIVMGTTQNEEGHEDFSLGEGAD